MGTDTRIVKLVDSLAALSDDEIVAVVSDLDQSDRSAVCADLSRRAAQDEPARRLDALRRELRAMAEKDLVAALARGDHALAEADGVSSQPIELYQAIDHMVREAPEEAVDVVFFAAVDRIVRGGSEEAPEAFRDLDASYAQR